MARKLELTWQSGTAGRTGRWRKKFRGKTYYFDGGRGKTDRVAYAQATADWTRLKSVIEEQDSKPNESDYMDVLREWRAVKDWSSQNADQGTLVLARSKIKDLETRLASRRPPPISPEDRFESRFSYPTIPLDFMDDPIGQKRDLEPIDWTHISAGMAKDQGRIVPPPGAIENSDGSPARIAKEIWRDRIAAQLRESDKDDAPATIEGNIARFLVQKRAQVDGKQLTPGRYAMLDLHLSALSEFIGGSNRVSAITTRSLTDFRTDLLGRKGRGELSGAYAKDRLGAATQFVRWLWREMTLVDLPRVIEDRSFTITAEAPVIKTLTIAETKALLEAAIGQVKLFILLGLNTGMTQKDISNLNQDEVNWTDGVIRRKRSKTRSFGNVPEVTYKLWPETFRLLKEYRLPNSSQVLGNENGGSLVTVKLKDDGGLYKVDGVHARFARLCSRAGIKGRPFKSLRKTSATLLRGNEKYTGLEDLFLGHAPRTMSDRHYSGIPHELMANALDWLGRELGLVAGSEQPASPDRQPAKRESRPARGRSKKGANTVAINGGR